MHPIALPWRLFRHTLSDSDHLPRLFDLQTEGRVLKRRERWLHNAENDDCVVHFYDQFCLQGTLLLAICAFLQRGNGGSSGLSGMVPAL